MTAGETLASWVRGGSGPKVAKLFAVLLGAISAIAFASMLVQVRVLVGEHGLLPATDFFRALRLRGAGFSELPSLFWLGSSDAALVATCLVGIAVSLAGAIVPRVPFAFAFVLYLSLSVACQTFCGFQWDILLTETLFLAILLPTDRACVFVHVLFRILLFKLYFESGIAKWQSHLHDWQDGSAMTYYYETAPIPAPLAWYAHHLPTWWHHLESRGVLAFEIGVPFLIFGPRHARLTAFFVFGAFQLANILTANYGFFSYLALALHVFLLDERDVPRWLEKIPTALSISEIPKAKSIVRAIGGAWFVASALDGYLTFGPNDANETLARIDSVVDRARIANTYHLFGHITRERIEPEFQVFDGSEWRPLDLRYKPGDPKRGLPLVAPHQPRVDFQLWFYGLSYRAGMPRWVASIVSALCDDPAKVAPLFEKVPPPSPESARIGYWKYTFTSKEERAATGNVWHREWLGASGPRPCRR